MKKAGVVAMETELCKFVISGRENILPKIVRKHV